MAVALTVNQQMTDTSTALHEHNPVVLSAVSRSPAFEFLYPFNVLTNTLFSCCLQVFSVGNNNVNKLLALAEKNPQLLEQAMKMVCCRIAYS